MLRPVVRNMVSLLSFRGAALPPEPLLRPLVTSSAENASHAAAAAAGLAPPQGLDEAGTQLELLRRSNNSMRQLVGQTILVRVKAVDRKFAFLETGRGPPVRYARRELPLEQRVLLGEGEDVGTSMERRPREVRVGDAFQMKIVSLQTPYGDMQLEVAGTTDPKRHDKVWAELEVAHRRRQPVLGRVLNSVTAGYAVGVGGLVCFCPTSRMLGATAKRVGVLQPFLPERLLAERRNVLVWDWAWQAREDAQRRLHQRLGGPPRLHERGY